MSVFVRVCLSTIFVAAMLLPYGGYAAGKSVTPKYAVGWQNYAQGYRPLTATKSGKRVTISGLAQKSTNGAWGVIATLPSDMRPKQRMIFNVNTNEKTARVDVESNGNISFHAGETAYGWVSLDGITFTTGSLQSLTPSNGWQNYGNGYAPLSATLDGDTVTLSGLVKGTAGEIITTLPSDMRPSARRIFNANSHDLTSRVDVLAHGEVRWSYRGPNREWVSLSGISFDRKVGEKLKLGAGWTNYGGEYSTPSVVKKGQRITVSGLLKGGSKWGHLATLPKGYCPENRLIFNLNNHDQTSRIDVLTDCRIMWVAGGKGHGWISLDGISFFLSDSGKNVANTSNASPVSVPWRELPGKAIDVDVGANGAAWKVGHDHTIWRWDGKRFNKMSGGAKRIAVDPQGNAWVVNQGKAIYRHDGQAWKQIKGQALDIDVGADGTVWMVGHDQTIWRWDGQRFKKMPGGGLRIAVDAKGNAWITNSGKNIYRYDGKKWHEVPGQAIDIATGGDGSVWVIGTDNAPYKWTGKAGKTWEKYAGAITGISVGPKGYPWAVNGDSKAFADNRSPGYKNPPKALGASPKPNNVANTSNASPVSVPWRELPGKAIDVDVGANGAAWKVGHDHTIWRWDGKRFNKMSGGAKRIAVDPQGNAWVVNQGKAIYRHDGQAWKQIKGQALDIDVGADGTVWMVGHDQTIWRWDGQRFKKMPGGGLRIAVDAKGNAWITNSGKNIYRYDGKKWHEVPGQAIDIATGGDGSVWVIGTDNAPYKWTGKTGKTWEKYAGAITGISVGPKGYPWAVNGDSKAFADNRSPAYKTAPKVNQSTVTSSTAPDASSVQKDIRKNPAFSTLSLSNIKQSNGVLTATAKVGKYSVTVVAWHAEKGKPAISAILVPNMSISELLPKLESGNKMAAYKMTDLVVFTVPSGAQNSALKVSSLPPSVADELVETDPAMEGDEATISLDPGMTYFGAVDAGGIVEKAFDMMQLAQPMSLTGSLALTGYSTPQNEVTLTARLKKDPLKLIMGDKFEVITVADKATPSLYVKANGNADIEVGYSSTLNVFKQELDGTVFFGASGKGAAAETSIGIQLTREGRWNEPHLFNPIKAEKVTLNDADITLERVIKNTGTSTTLSVVTSSTKIHSTTYDPAAFSFTLEGTSNLPKAVFVDLATSELSVLQLAELSEVALQMTPQGQLNSALNPYSSDEIKKVLQLDKLPLGKITIRDPKIYLGTVDAVVPALDPIPDPVLPPISGAGVHVRGEFEAFEKKFAETNFQLDFNGLKTETEGSALKMGPFDLGKARFKIDAIPGKQPLAHFSGAASFANITLAAAEFDLEKDKFSYEFDTGCAPLTPGLGLLKFTAKGSSEDLKISDSMFGSVPEPGTCILDALELLSNALEEGIKLVSMGSDLVTGITSDTWKGLADGASGVLTSSFVNNSINSFGSADKAASAFANTGRDAANKLADSITNFLGSGNSSPKPRYKDTPETTTDSSNPDGKCFADDDWSIEYARCWRRGHEFVRLASNTNLCLSIRKRIREQGKAIEVSSCDGGWHQQWKWTGPVTAKGFARRDAPIVDGWKGDWCMDREGRTGDPKAGQRLESKECRQEQRQDFVRDQSDRLVHSSGYCLEAFAPHDENEVHLQSCSNNPNQRWLFKAQGSSFKTLLPSPSLLEGTIATTRLVTHQGKCIYTSPFGHNDLQSVGVGTCKKTQGYYWKVTPSWIQALQHPTWCVGTTGSSNAEQNLLDTCPKTHWSINVDKNKLRFSHSSKSVSKCLAPSGTKLIFVDCNPDDASQFFEFTRN